MAELDGNRGIRQSLTAKLRTGDRLFQNGLPCPAAHVVSAFINQSLALNGRKISPPDAGFLINQADELIRLLAAGGVCLRGPDADGDFISDEAEISLNTQSSNSDSDGDRASDGDELLEIGSDPLIPDTDGDGCEDGQELRSQVWLGGQRDPVNFWDFMDMPTGSSLKRDGSVGGADIAAVVERFGRNDSEDGSDDRFTDPLSRPPRNGYHPAFDRGGTYPGEDVWDLLPADGSIAGSDIVAVVLQFGHRC